MDWDAVHASIDLILDSEKKNVKIKFSGGEPLLEFLSVLRACEYAEQRCPRKKHLRYEISTNGILLNDKIVSFLDEHNFNVRLSFDGIEDSQNIRGQGTFSNLDATLDNLINNHSEFFRRKLTVSITLIPATVKYLSDSIRYFVNKGVRKISILPDLCWDAAWTKGHVEELEKQFSQIFSLSEKQFYKSERIPLFLFGKTDEAAIPKNGNHPMCSAGNLKSIVVDVDGEICPCMLFAKSYRSFWTNLHKTCIDNIKIGGLEQSKLRESFAAYPKAIQRVGLFDHKEMNYSSHGSCGDCEYLSACLICPFSLGSDGENNTSRRVPDFLCAFNRISFKYRDKFDSLTAKPASSDPIEPLLAFLRANEMYGD